MKYVLVALFVVSLISAPWWVVVPLGIILTTIPLGIPVAVLGGVYLDAVFGAPIASLGGMAHLYTALFVGAGLLSTLIAGRVVD